MSATMTSTAPTPEATDVRLRRSRLRPSDRVRTGLGGLASRPGRTLLTALGIAIGIASMVTVVGISSSSKADLLAELDELGTNLLQVRPGQSLFGDSATLPPDADAMVRRVATVEDTAGIISIPGDVQRNDHEDEPNGLGIVATDGRVNDTLGLTARTGRVLGSSEQHLPVVVLGSLAAERLGIDDLTGGPTITLGDDRYQVIGILDSHPLHPDLDRSVMIGEAWAKQRYGIDPNHSAIYVRVAKDRVEVTRPLLARTSNPAAPNEVEVSRPSDALEAQTKVDDNLQNLLLALGGVALLVGGVGIANIMVISVIERRAEIGLRRALGASRGHIRSQFVIESAALSTLGGALGIALGVGATAAYASSQGWTLSVPAAALGGGVLAALAIGALAGLYPAAKAARLDPADAVRPHA